MNILAAVVEEGLTFLDTADVYGAGRSEVLDNAMNNMAGMNE